MSMRFMIVDDTRFMRIMLTDILRRLHYEVVGEADNGYKGVELYKELRPDIVFMDISMPEMDGVQALQKIRAFDPNAIVIICSAVSQQDLIADAMKMGANSYVMKPFKPKQIKEVVEKFLPAVVETPVVAAHAAAEAAQEPVKAEFDRGTAQQEEFRFDFQESPAEIPTDFFLGLRGEAVEEKVDMNESDAIFPIEDLVKEDEALIALDGAGADGFEIDALGMDEPAEEAVQLDADLVGEGSEVLEIVELVETDELTEAAVNEEQTLQEEQVEQVEMKEPVETNEEVIEEVDIEANATPVFREAVHVEFAEAPRTVETDKIIAWPAEKSGRTGKVRQFEEVHSCRWAEDWNGKEVLYRASYGEGELRVRLESSEDTSGGFYISVDAMRELLGWIDAKSGRSAVGASKERQQLR